MNHKCNGYCLNFTLRKSSIKLQTCVVRFRDEQNKDKENTPSKPLQLEPAVVEDSKGIEHFEMKQEHSRRAVQHSRSI